jgi:hypothetical protein
MSIHSVPEEILEHIFLSIEPDVRDYDRRGRRGIPTLEPFAPPLVLTCQRWKRIIYDTGQLWSTGLSLSYDYDVVTHRGPQYLLTLEQKLQDSFARFRNSLDNSGQSNLIVHLDADDVPRPSDIERRIADTFALIAPRSHQLSYLSFLISPQNMGPHIARVFRDFQFLPRLEVVRFSQTQIPPAETFPSGEDKLDLSRAVNLTELTVSHANILQHIRPPRNLQNLDATNISTPDIPVPWRGLCEFVQAAPLMQFIAITGLELDLTFPAPFSNMELPNLADLIIEASISTYISFVEVLSLPQLQSLSVTFSNIADRQDWEAEGSDDHVFPSFPMLWRLLVVTDIWTPAVENFIAQTPPASLEEFKLTYRGDLQIEDADMLAMIRPPRLTLPPLIKPQVTYTDHQPYWAHLLDRLDLSKIRDLSVGRNAIPGEIMLRPPPSALVPIQFPSLRSLHMTGFNAPETEVFCQNISAPGLESAEFTGNFPDDEAFQPFPRSVGDLISNNNADFLTQDFFTLQPPPIYLNLTVLTITVTPGTPSQEPALTLFPRVIELCLKLTLRGRFGKDAEEVLAPLAPSVLVIGRNQEGGTGTIMLQRSEDFSRSPSGSAGMRTMAMPQLKNMKLVFQIWQGRSQDHIQQEVLNQQVGEEGQKFVQDIIDKRKAVRKMDAGEDLRVNMCIQFRDTLSWEVKTLEYWRNFTDIPGAQESDGL